MGLAVDAGAGALGLASVGGDAGAGLEIGALDEWLMPIERATVEEASREAFSRICFCFSSSFARITTRSSGIGLFSYRTDERSEEA
jgi:hypothetical protein